MGQVRPLWWHGNFLVLAFVALAASTMPVSAQDQPKIEIVPVVGHSSPVQSVAFSPDGTRVLSGSGPGPLSSGGLQVMFGGGDQTIKLWDAATGALIRTFEGHASPIQSLAF